LRPTWLFLSIRMTRFPRSDAAIAAIIPAGPAPIIAISYLLMPGLLYLAAEGDVKREPPDGDNDYGTALDGRIWARH